jgi:hypothetical protein
MGIKLQTWDDGQTKVEVQKRFKNCQESRVHQEDRWIKNERSVYSSSGSGGMSGLNTSLESSFGVGMPGPDGSGADMNVAYTFRNFRFIHAQMSSNPPSVVMRPTSSDQEDHRKADAADRIVRWAIRHYQMQEKVDQLSLHCLLYGTGALKTIWDATKGDIIDFDQETEELTLEGDVSLTVPFIWNLFLDPDAKSISDIKFVIERVYMDFAEAVVRWPDKQDILKKARVEKKSGQTQGRDSQLDNNHYNSVELLEYWETGLASNGYLGRFCITTAEGDVVQSTRPSPFRFKRAGAVSKIEAMDISDDEKEARIAKIPEQARLPYHILTEIDVPNMAWGRSFIEYTSGLQDNLNRLDSARLDNLQAHSVARLIVPESAEIADDGLSNSPWDVTKIAGNQPPYFMSAPQMMPDMTPMRQDMVSGINDVSGMNESMFGQQSREQAAAAMQYATNQGNTIRRRLFNKYVLVVESIFGIGILNLIRKHWTTERTINVLGKEKALEAIDLKGADIDGGYDVVGEYGVSLSLDPITRRQEIMQMQPMFEKAGVPPRTILRMAKLSELEGLYDKTDMAGARQKEIFDVMIATGNYIPPKKYRDHENMIAWALDYFMTSEYEMLDSDTQNLCEHHIEERGTLAAQESGGAPTTPVGSPGPAGAGAPPPPPGTPVQAGPVPADTGGPAPGPVPAAG